MNRNHFTIGAGVLVLFLSQALFSQVSPVDAIAEKEIKSGRFIGMTIGVARDREILHLKGYGMADLENTVPATEKTVFRIGSITKMFTAVSILQLVEEGKLQLDDPLTKYLADYPDPENLITIRHLLNHTSGIANVTELPGFRETRKRDLKPKNLRPFSKTNRSSFLPVKNFATATRAICSYTMWGKQIVNAPYVSMSQPYSAGALASTAGDMLKWMPGNAEGKVVNQKSFQLMTTPGRLNDDTKIRYGLGCFK